MEIFEVPPDEFEDGPEFNRYLSRNYSALSDDDLYIISGVTELPQAEFEEQLEERGWIDVTLDRSYYATPVGEMVDTLFTWTGLGLAFFGLVWAYYPDMEPVPPEWKERVAPTRATT